MTALAYLSHRFTTHTFASQVECVRKTAQNFNISIPSPSMIYKQHRYNLELSQTPMTYLKSKWNSRCSRMNRIHSMIEHVAKPLPIQIFGWRHRGLVCFYK